jgi:hypothetical protein
MKKTIEKPDGTKITIEGAPDEISRYDQQNEEKKDQHENVLPSPRGKEILKGESARLIEMELENARIRRELEEARRHAKRIPNFDRRFVWNDEHFYGIGRVWC